MALKFIYDELEPSYESYSLLTKAGSKPPSVLRQIGIIVEVLKSLHELCHIISNMILSKVQPTISGLQSLAYSYIILGQITACILLGTLVLIME